MDAIETIERDGCVGEIHLDDYPTNPRDMGDYHVAVLTQLSNRYGQPDVGWDPSVLRAWEDGTRYHDTEKVERYARAFLGAVAVEWWDDPRSASRIFGYVTREAAETAGVTDPLAALNAELSEYAAWCQGDVYGYTVETEDGEELESCWGYYGDDELDYVRSLINDAIDRHRDAKHAERVGMFKRLLEAS